MVGLCGSALCRLWSSSLFFLYLNHCPVVSSRNIQARTDTMNRDQTQPTSEKLSGEEIAKHNSRESCWVIIHGKAYDVTEVCGE